jgi:hypothetical protein
METTSIAYTKLWNKVMLYWKLHGSKLSACCFHCKYANGFSPSPSCPKKRIKYYYSLYKANYKKKVVERIGESKIHRNLNNSVTDIPLTVCEKFFRNPK